MFGLPLGSGRETRKPAGWSSANATQVRLRSFDTARHPAGINARQRPLALRNHWRYSSFDHEAAGKAMVWDSVPLMTAIDLMIIAAAVYSIWRCHLIDVEPRLGRASIARLLVNLGLLGVALFYAADLATMHVLPAVTGTHRAMEAMESLHRNLNWFVMLFVVGTVSFGFVELLVELQRRGAEAQEHERRYRVTQTELAHAGRVITMGELTASISHEVNQPITAMIGNAEATLQWLARDPPEIQESRQLLTRIVRDGHRAGNVVVKIRDLVKKTPPRMERIDINCAMREVIELTRGEAVKSGVSVHNQFAEGLPLIEADRVQLQQVALNLIINAIQALGKSGNDPRELIVSTSVSGSNVSVSVRDSGPGVSPESLSHLFDPFFTTKPDGTGIGLSICRSIIESHSGRIWATANAPRGAAFHFTIPVARPQNG
jgi:signal transduction histidine kinase